MTRDIRRSVSIRRARDTFTTGTRRSRDWSRYRAASADVELLEAAFDQHVYERRFHDTDAIGVTLRGVQRFRGGGGTHDSVRWRLSLAKGEPRYAELERRLASGPVIGVPNITLDGDSDGVAPASDGTSYAAKFAGKRTHRIVKGAGHNLPQEAPEAFAAAVIDVAGYR